MRISQSIERMEQRIAKQLILAAALCASLLLGASFAGTLIALGMCSFLTFGDLRDKRFQISGVSSRVYSSDKGTSLSC